MDADTSAAASMLMSWGVRGHDRAPFLAMWLESAYPAVDLAGFAPPSAHVRTTAQRSWYPAASTPVPAG